MTSQPGTGGCVVLAALGWRGGTLPSDLTYNGFYVSKHWGKAGTFHRITPSGDIDIGEPHRERVRRHGSGAEHRRGQALPRDQPGLRRVHLHTEPVRPEPQFITLLKADVNDPTHWVTGGEFIWDDHPGWNTHCSATACDSKIVHDTHASTTALGVNGSTIYAGWCALPCNPASGVPFQSGIDTNAGGTWHAVHAPNLPNRFITWFDVDRNDANHVVVTFGGFSRRWIPAGGVGHVFESWNGGQTWKNMSGNLPDNPADDVAIVHHKLVVATDLGVFVARDGSHHWARLGHGLPDVATWNLAVSPNRRYVVAATPRS